MSSPLMVHHQGLLPNQLSCPATWTEKEMRFVNQLKFEILARLAPAAWGGYQPMSTFKKRGMWNIYVGKDNEVTVPPPVVWLHVDVVSLYFKQELIAVFRQRSV